MCNHLKSRGWKQKCNPVSIRGSVCSPSPCADPGKTWTSALRCSSHAHGDTLHMPPSSLSRFNAGPACTIMSAQSEPNQQEVQLRRFYPYGSSPSLYASLWRGHFTDLPGFADVQFDCNNETCIAPPEKSVSSQHTGTWQSRRLWENVVSGPPSQVHSRPRWASEHHRRHRLSVCQTAICLSPCTRSFFVAHAKNTFWTDSLLFYGCIAKAFAHASRRCVVMFLCTAFFIGSLCSLKSRTSARIAHP